MSSKLDIHFSITQGAEQCYRARQEKRPAMSQLMTGKVVVVSGASTGVGRAAAIHFGRDGAAVVLLARRKDHLDEVAGEIGSTAVPIATDVTNGLEVRAAFTQITEQFGRVDVLINSAGASRIRLIEEATDDDIAV